MPTRDEIQAFSLQIAEIVEARQLEWMEAVLQHCAERGLDIELAAKLLSEGIKAKIRIEAENLNYMKKDLRLPI